MQLWQLAVLLTLVYSVSHGHDEHHPRMEGTPQDEHHPRIERSTRNSYNQERDQRFWVDKAQLALQRHLNQVANKNVAKNVILFLGDGLSLPTLAAARVYSGQSQGFFGEETVLPFEWFPYTGLSRTYCVDSQVADSACSATAYLGGVKSNSGTIGVSASVGRQDCVSSRNESNHVLSLLHWAQDAGKGTGLVTTTRVTHASPAGVYAHVAERGWEDDVSVHKDGHNHEKCPDIAKQLIMGETGSRLNVILGGGRKHFLSENEKTSRGISSEGKRRDKINLIDVWKQQKRQWNATFAYVKSKRQLIETPSTVDYLLGLFNQDHLSYHLEAQHDEPTIEEMTVAAINRLSKSPRGYVLFVEGGRIDHAHHDNLAKKSLDETVEFGKAVAAADALTDSKDTLIVVTADHAHVMTYGGYASRGNDILGLAGEGSDGLPYATLSYANGPGYVKYFSKKNLRSEHMDHNLFKFPAMVPLSTETHGGEDVAVFARGPWSHLFTGSYEQSYIPHAIGYAACIGDGLKACSRARYA